FSTLEHIDLEAHAEIGRTTGRVSADLSLGPHRTPVHLDASLPIPTRRKGPIAAHLVTHNLLLRDLPDLGLERHGIKGGVVDLEVVVDGTLASPAVHLEAGLRDVRYRDLLGLSATANLVSRDGHTNLSASVARRGRSLLDLHADS